MLIRILLFILVHIAPTTAVECFYKGAHQSSNDPLKSMQCEHGCCGTTHEQECCEVINWWMIFAFVLAGSFIIFVIVAAIYLIVKQKNKKRERVGNFENHSAYERQPSTVDLSVFRTGSSRASEDPPAYTTMYQSRTSNNQRISGYEEYFEPEASENRWNETSWRNSDLSYFDKYLERSANKGTGNQVELSTLNRAANTGNHPPPTKLAAEYEDFRFSTQPELTAEVTYLGHTSNNPSEPTFIEGTDGSRFHSMANN